MKVFVGVETLFSYFVMMALFVNMLKCLLHKNMQEPLHSTKSDS